MGLVGKPGMGNRCTLGWTAEALKGSMEILLSS